MATKPKKNARYDLNAADRRRNLLIQIGLTSIVVLLGVGLVLYIVMGADKKPAAGEAKSIQVSSSKLITKEGTTEPKAVVSLYEDFLCPHCGDFEKTFGPTINQLIDSGAIAADYYMVAILDSPSTAELLLALGRCRVLRGRRVEGGVPPLPCRAVRAATRRNRWRFPR